MAAIDDFAKETANRIGPGAYLTNILPSVVLVLTTGALFASRLMPWSGATNPGPAQVVRTVKDNPWTTGVVLILAVIVVAILLRPFQIAMVQVLEGYWRNRFWLRPIEAMAVERHIRKAGSHVVRLDTAKEIPTTADFRIVARVSRREHRRTRRAEDSLAALSSYPPDVQDFLPTRLGNALRRGETTAGERYGLNTVVTFPRLQPHLHAKLEAGIVNQLDLIDTTSAFTLLFTVQALVSAPLVWRLDGWSVVPVVFLLFAGLAYRGARGIAVRHSELLRAAYDMHRFDMVKALHRKLPRTTATEFAENRELSRFLAQDKPNKDVWYYDHGGA